MTEHTHMIKGGKVKWHGDRHWLLHVLCVTVVITKITVDDGDDNS